MLVDLDLFPAMKTLFPLPVRGNYLQKIPVTQSPTSTPVIPGPLPPPPWVAVSSGLVVTHGRNGPGLSNLSPTHHPKIAPSGDGSGWYVVYNGVHPGVYRGS